MAEVTAEAEQQRQLYLSMARALWRVDKDSADEGATFEEHKQEMMQKARKLEKNLKSLGLSVTASN